MAYYAGIPWDGHVECCPRERTQMKDYVYVAPDYRIGFSNDGKRFSFVDDNYIIIINGKLVDGDWLVAAENRGVITTDIVSIPYETLVLFRKALAIKGLEYLLDREVTLVEEK